MDFLHKKIFILFQICILLFSTTSTTAMDDINLRNHRNGILSLRDVADSWIGYPKSPYTSFSVTVSPATIPTTQPTPLPQNPTKKPKKKKYKKSVNNKRRYDSYEDSSYKDEQRNRENYAFKDFDDYDYDGPIESPYSKVYPPAPYILRSSGAAPSPKTAMVNPSLSTNSQPVRAIYAEPKVATYVIPNSKRYVVQRVKAEMAYMPPVSIPPSPSMYTSASNSGMRRLDPMDYDDNGGGGSYLNLGPQDSFPPRPVMAKISQPGQRQPCHGPECHKHHKGLVRFYWRRVVYPRNSRQRLRGRGRGRTRRRRFRDGGRAPSDQKDIYYPDDDNNGDEEEPSNDEANTFDDNNEEEEVEENEDNDENDSSRRNVWQPRKGYGHDLDEGSNYDDQDKKVYRDKRYIYRNKRKRRRGTI